MEEYEQNLHIKDYKKNKQVIINNALEKWLKKQLEYKRIEKLVTEYNNNYNLDSKKEERLTKYNQKFYTLNQLFLVKKMNLSKYKQFNFKSNNLQIDNWKIVFIWDNILFHTNNPKLRPCIVINKNKYLKEAIVMKLSRTNSSKYNPYVIELKNWKELWLTSASYIYTYQIFNVNYKFIKFQINKGKINQNTKEIIRKKWKKLV